MFNRPYFVAGVLFALFANAASVANSASRLSMGLEAPSPVLGHTIRYWAYLPEDPLPRAQRYPVVYLLHGLHGNETRWFRSGLIAPLLDAAIAAGKIPPLIVVTPDGGDSGMSTTLTPVASATWRPPSLQILLLQSTPLFRRSPAERPGSLAAFQWVAQAP